MRISLVIVASEVDLSTDFIPLEVFPDMTLNDLKAIVQDEINVQPDMQHFLQNNQPISDTSKTFTQLNIGEGDVLGLAIGNLSQASRRRRSGQGQEQGSASQRPRQGPDPESVRLHILGDANMMAQVRARDPDLAEAANNHDRFHNLWHERQRMLDQEQRQKEEQQALLDADPFNPEAQAKIEELIQNELIQENFQKAMEENPESFGRVTMLYIDVLVNNVPIKAFVDSGAQTTIMSPDAAKRCQIQYLIDKRFGGVAHGVGTAKILGRVSHASIQIGQFTGVCSFTVMEGKDVDLLLGLDMLKRHQMCIDLKKNCLRVHDQEIPFLPESEIPKMMEEILNKEPKIEGPGGTTIGATTGTVEAPGTSTSTASASAETTSETTGSSTTATTKASSSTSTTNTTAQTRPDPSQNPFGQSQPITAQSIAQITELGFSREEAIAALRQVGGNVELAIGLLL